MMSYDPEGQKIGSKLWRWGALTKTLMEEEVETVESGSMIAPVVGAEEELAGGRPGCWWMCPSSESMRWEGFGLCISRRDECFAVSAVGRAISGAAEEADREAAEPEGPMKEDDEEEE
jgi:hypothetical protein